MALLQFIALFLIVLKVTFLSGANAAHPPLLPSNSSYIWFPTDNGTLVKAYLEGGPNVNARSSGTVAFYLHTRDFPGGRQIKLEDSCKTLAPYLIAGAPLKVLIHGFGGCHETSAVCADMKDAYLLTGEYNVITTCWRDMAAQPWYGTACDGARVVGSALAQLLLRLVLDCGLISLSLIHLIGHSLGAHACGFAGAEIFSRCGYKVGRITGLDAAGPNFEGSGLPNRLDSTDGAFVDCLHTDEGSSWWGHFGTTDRSGHCDYYPNGGSYQPGCPWYSRSGTTEYVPAGELGCSHGRAVYYWIESILNRRAFPCCCSSWKESSVADACYYGYYYHMGEDWPWGGPFCYLDTRDSSPFSMPLW